MQTILLDVGNTRIKIGLLEPHGLRFVAALNLDPQQDCAQRLAYTLRQEGIATQAVWAVSVASADLNTQIEQALETCDIRWVRSEACAAGIRNAYPNPNQLGADRWVGVIGLTHHFVQLEQPIILASFGTATTIDTLTARGEFLGGLILPGVGLMREALNTGTANLPIAHGELAAFPTNTHSAITSGIAAAQIGALQRQIDHIERISQRPPVICVTGGAWQAIADECHALTQRYRLLELPHIVLDGLAVLAKEAGSQHKPLQ